MPKVVAQMPIDTGDPVVNLLAAILRRAIEDASTGCAEAQRFIEVFAPEVIKDVSKMKAIKTKTIQTFFTSERLAALWPQVVEALPARVQQSLGQHLHMVTDSKKMAAQFGADVDCASCVVSAKPKASGAVIYVNGEYLRNHEQSYVAAVLAHEIAHVEKGHHLVTGAVKMDTVKHFELQAEALAASWGFRSLYREELANTPVLHF